MTEASKPSTNSTPGLQMAVSLSAVTQPSTSDSEAPSFRELIPIPTKLEPNSNQSSRKRRVGHACVITASPHKRMLVEAREQKKESIQKKEERKAKLMLKKLEAKSKKVGKAKETNRRPQRKRKQNVRTKDRQRNSDAASDEPDCPCLYCGGLYSQSSEDFVACQGNCGKWAHIGCANLSASGQFVCEVCED